MKLILATTVHIGEHDVFLSNNELCLSDTTCDIDLDVIDNNLNWLKPANEITIKWYPDWVQIKMPYETALGNSQRRKAIQM